MNSTYHHIHQIEETLIDKLIRQAEEATDPHIKRQLMIAATEMVDRSLLRLTRNCSNRGND